MPALSILICGHGSTAAFELQLRELHHALRSREFDYEVLLVGDQPPQDSAKFAESFSLPLRFVPSRYACGDIASLVRSGLVASRGENIALLEFGNRPLCRYVPALMDRLARADFVQGKRRREGLHKLSHRLARIPQWLVLGLDVRDPGCLFWAARREALGDITIQNNLLRYLGPLVAQNGFRVDEIAVPYTNSDDSMADQPIIAGSLLAAWREKQRLKGEQHLQTTLVAASDDRATRTSSPATIPFPMERRKSA